jgi:hypothetical protein
VSEVPASNHSWQSGHYIRSKRISQHNLHERLAVTGPNDEIKDLTDTIDGLLGRLQNAFRRAAPLRRQRLP